MQGRGSAANSAVCYSLGITAVDPVGMELLFERFLSEERGEWPDIDLDLPSGDQRERVIQYLYKRYGERGAAMTANVITYRSRMASREMGKALGFDPETLEKVSTAVSTWEYRDAHDTLDHRFRDAGLDLNHPRLRKYFELCEAVQDLPRHLGQHSGGMVICQGQLDSVVPLEPASMPGRVVVQWDKEDCADLGIIKVDLLGLGMMAVLEDSIELIRDHYGEEVDLAHLPADDPAVYSTLQKADTIGMFQIESRAQMSCLPRLRPQRFYDIVVQVAIIRPGPIVGQMVNPLSSAAWDASRSPIRTPRSSRCWRALWACRFSRNSYCAWPWWSRNSAAARRKNCAGPWASNARRNACRKLKPSFALAWNATVLRAKRRSRSYCPSHLSRFTDFPNPTPPASR